jgi:hypothetical protein
MIREIRPTPCLRCESALPLMAIPRNELYFYTAGLSLSESGLMTDTEQHPRGRLCEGCTRTFVEWLKVREAPTEPPPLREVIPLHAHADDARVLFSVSPSRSTCPTDVHVKESDGTPWRVITVTVDGVSRAFGELPYPVCPGNRWIDLEVVCPHDHPPTKGASVELRGVVVCTPSDLPVAAADSERDQRWANDVRKPRGAQKLPNGEWETTFRGDSTTLSLFTRDTDSKE